MDEQTSTASTTPDPVATDSPAVVQPTQAEPAQVAEPAQTVPPEPIPETQTAQTVGNEPLGESTPVSESAVASAHAPEVPTAVSAPIIIPAPQNRLREFLALARANIQGRKTKKFEKIMELLEKKGKLTNDDVEKLLHVSDATATRYLSALEKQNKIKQSGKTGKSVSYTKV